MFELAKVASQIIDNNGGIPDVASCAAQVVGESVSFAGVSIDTRKDCRNTLFVAIAGERFDGHDFIAQARERGAVAAMVNETFDASAIEGDFPLLRVTNTLDALCLWARAHRAEYDIPVVALTGSCGKTTTKAMLASILSQVANTHVTQGNFNNEIGLPLSILQLDESHHYAVFELGANHIGEIAKLSAMAQPDVALITLVAPAHLEGFGSIEGVYQAKSEIFAALDDDGVMIYNADDNFALKWQEQFAAKTKLAFGIDNPAQVYASDIEQSNDSVRFQLHCELEGAAVMLPAPGKHNVMNALAASACMRALDIPMSAIVTGLANFEAVPGRLNIKQGINDSVIIDDTYNASPRAVKAALDVLANNDGNKILVLGDMGELGESASELHRDIGVYARQVKVDALYTMGPLARHTSEGFGDQAFHFEDHTSLAKAVKASLTPETTVLVKGSRSMQMEKVVSALLS